MPLVAGIRVEFGLKGVKLTTDTVQEEFKLEKYNSELE